MNEDIQAHPGSLKPTGADLAVPYKGGVNCKGPEVTNLLLGHTALQCSNKILKIKTLCGL